MIHCKRSLAVAAAVYLAMLQTNHATAVRSIAFGAAVVLALVYLALSAKRPGDRPPAPPLAVVAAFLAWGGWSALSWTWSVNPAYSASQLEREVLDLALAAFALYVAPTGPLAFRTVVGGALAGFAVLALVAVAASLGAAGWDAARFHHGVGPWSTWVVIVASLVVPLVAVSPRTRAMRASTLALAFALLALIVVTARLTDNRMVWPALAAVFATAALAAAIRWPRRFRETHWRWLAPLAAALLATGLGLAFYDTAEEKASRDFPPDTTVTQTIEQDPRLLLWERVRERIGERPWTGYGFGRRILAEDLSSDLRNPLLTHAHNLFASQALQTGIPGAAAFALLLLALADRFRRFVASRDDAVARVGVVGLALIAGFVVKNLTDDFLFRSNAREFWCLCALLLGWGMRLSRGAGGTRATGAHERAPEAVSA